MRIYSFGAVLVPQLNGSNSLPVGFRSATIELRGGGFDQDGGNSYLESKMITVSFWVSIQDVLNIDDFLDSLYAEGAKGRQTIVAKMRNGELRKNDGKMIQGITKPRANLYVPDSITGMSGYEVCNVTFEITYPLWKVVDDLGLDWDDGWQWDDGLDWDTSGTSEASTISGTETLFSVDNIGAVAHEDTRLVITGGAGATVTDVRVDNLTTGEYLDWTGVILAGEILTIKTLAQTIDLDGVGEFDNTVLGTTQLGFWSLALGVNDFKITVTSVTGGTADAELFWERQYAR